MRKYANLRSVEIISLTTPQNNNPALQVIPSLETLNPSFRQD